MPPTHRSAAIEWPVGKPSAATDFVTVAAAPLDTRAFRRAVFARSARRGGEPARLFVHGYNYSYQESVFRLAQLASDADVVEPTVLFAWPSKADPFGYEADRKSAAGSRAALASVVAELGGRSDRGLILLSHSMGSWLTMEALVQLRRDGRDASFKRFRDVVLAAPDIAVEDFLRQLEAIGPMRTPITVLVSTDDEALGLSRLLSGGRNRVGSADIHDPRVIRGAERFNVRVVDISELSSTDGFKHDRFAALASLYPKFRKQLESRSNPEFASAGVFVFNARTAKLTRSGRPL